MTRQPELNIRPLSDHLGGELPNIDVRDIGGSVSTEAIKSALYEHQLLCFRD